MASRLEANFALGLEIGRGAFGVVSRALRLRDGLTCACKTVPLSALSHKLRAATVQEASLLRKLDSPYVVHYLDSFLDGESMHIILEYCEGGSLADRLRRQPPGLGLPEALTWRLVAQMLLGLEYLHNHRIIHRDIKPSNVFLSLSGDARIGDLGVAKVLEATDHARSMVGTPSYMAPEVLEQRPYGEKSDIWAIGCVVYESCSLRRPYEALNTPALYIKILTQERKELPLSYSPELRGMIDACMQGKESSRPTASDLLNEGHLREQALKLGAGARPASSKSRQTQQDSSEASLEPCQERQHLLNILQETSKCAQETQHGHCALTDVECIASDTTESEHWKVMINCESFASRTVWSDSNADNIENQACSLNTLWDQECAEDDDDLALSATSNLALSATKASSFGFLTRSLSCSISPDPKGQRFVWDDASNVGTVTLCTSNRLHDTKRKSLTSLSARTPKTPSDEAILRDVLCDSPVTNFVQTLDKPEIDLLILEQGTNSPHEASPVKTLKNTARVLADQQLTGLDPVDSAMRKWQQASASQVQVQRIGKGRYRCGDGKRIFCRLDEEGELVVRQGSKFVRIDDFFVAVSCCPEAGNLSTNCAKELRIDPDRLEESLFLAKSQETNVVGTTTSDDALNAALLSHFRASGQAMHFKQIGKGKYRYGGRKIFCRLTHDKRVMVRKNSDFISLEDFLAENPQDGEVHAESAAESPEVSDAQYDKDDGLLFPEKKSQCIEKWLCVEPQGLEQLHLAIQTLQVRKRQLTQHLDETEARGRKACKGHLWREACDMLESHLSDELVDDPQQLEVENQLEKLVLRRSCDSAQQTPKAPLFLLCRRMHLQSEIEKCDLKLDEVLSMIQLAGAEPSGVSKPRRHSVV